MSDKSKNFNTITSLKKYLKQFKNQKFSFFIKDKNLVINKNNKGNVGNLIETHIFGIKQNNDKNADLKELNIDIKATQLKMLKNNEYRFKERLKIKSLNYEDEINYDKFEDTELFKKMSKLLLICYYGNKDTDIMDYKIVNTKILDFENEQFKNDLKQIMFDWNIINQKIKNGMASTISSSDTMYLEASTAGSGKERKSNKFTGEINLKQRAWSLKNSYMNTLIKSKNFESYLKNSEENLIEKLNKDVFELKNKTLKELCNELDIKYIQNFDEKSKYKSLVDQIISKKFNVVNYKKVDEFEKANIQIKVLQLKNNNIQENISFKPIKFCEEFAVDTKWEDTQLYADITKKFILITIEHENSQPRISNVINFRLSNDEIKEIKKVWSNEKQRYLNNDLKAFRVEYSDGKKFKQKNNFLKLSECEFIHLRPHATYGIYNIKSTEKDQDELIDGTKITKQSWWLNIKKVLKGKND